MTGRVLSSTYVDVALSEYEGGLAQPRHAHEPAYFTAVLAGAYEETVGRERSVVGRGAVLFHPAGEEHAVRFTARGTRIFRVLTHNAMHEAARLTGLPLDGIPRQVPNADSIVARMYAEFLRGELTSPLALDALACELVASVARGRRRARREAGKLGAHRARDLLEARLGNVPSLGDLADAAGCHPMTLARAFRRAFGCPVGAYVRRRRLEEACRLLRGSQTPIATIAALTGFADQAHMTRALRQVLGVTPAEYRRLA